MASGWDVTQPIDEESVLEGAGLAVELQFIWLKVISLSDCNDLAVKYSNNEKCSKLMGEYSQVTTNLTLCVVNPGNPKRGPESGKCYIYQNSHDHAKANQSYFGCPNGLPG